MCIKGVNFYKKIMSCLRKSLLLHKLTDYV